MRVPVLTFALMTAAWGCSREGDRAPSQPAAARPQAPTNRVDIPGPVRQNLGIEFAKVERRAVASTLRIPGSFELLPTARREYRAPMPGRIELLVNQFDTVTPGTALFRIDSADWRDLEARIAGTQARLDSMTPLREAHRVHEQSLADKVKLWKDRLAQLEELRAAGGGTASQFTEARAALNETQADLADVIERDAELQAQQKTLEAELRGLVGKRDALVRSAGMKGGQGGQGAAAMFEVMATAPGTVESLGITSGGLAIESQLMVTVVRPEQLRFRARGLQADLSRLREGLVTRIVPPSASGEVMSGTLRIGLSADPDHRTIDLFTQTEKLAAWARAGVAGHMEVVLAGGEQELAVPLSAVVRDGVKPIIFRRDPSNADKVIRLEADLGLSDGRWIVVKSGVKEGDEVVTAGNYQLVIATSGTTAKGGHFHPDGTFHEGGEH